MDIYFTLFSLPSLLNLKRNFRIIYFLIAGYSSRWERNSCEEVVYKFKTRCKRIHEWGSISSKASPQKFGSTLWVLCGSTREVARLWISSKRKPQLLSFWYGSISSITSSRRGLSTWLHVHYKGPMIWLFHLMGPIVHGPIVFVESGQFMRFLIVIWYDIGIACW